MELNQFIEKVFQKAKEYDIDDFEIYYEKGGSLALQTYQKEISSYTDSTEFGIAFRAVVKGKAASSFTEHLDDQAVDFIVEEAYQAAKLIENDDEINLFSGGSDYPQLQLYNPQLEQLSSEEKIDFVTKLDANTANASGIDKVMAAYYKDFDTECRLVNSKNLDVSYKRNIVYGAISVQAKDEQQSYTAFAQRIANDYQTLKDYDLKGEVVEKIHAKLGAKPIATGKYKVVFENEAFSDLLAVNFSNFSAEVAQKGMSLLKGKLNTKIASELVSIIDDPTLEGGFASAPFDGEGVPCFKKNIVEHGQFKTFLHNLNTAKKDGVKSTGNASRSSYKSSVGVSPSNAYIERGSLSVEELIAEVEDGVLITELDGLHAGANAVSGDFSLSARGFRIEKGKKTRAIKGIVVSGNFFTVLKSVKGIANDLDLSKSSIASPSIYVGDLEIAGE